MRSLIVPFLVGGLVLWFPIARPTVPSAPAPVQDQAPDTVMGTVQAADRSARTLTLVTGLSLALRAERLSVPPECRITVRDESGTLEDLHAGQVVRVGYATRDGRMIARFIEVVRPAHRDDRP